MTAFLASVTSVEEAAVVLEKGADIIDLKNPAQGTLGALPDGKVRDIVRFVAGRRLVSATIGDLPMQPEVLSDAVARMAQCGVDIVKVGFFGQAAHAECVQELAGCAARVRLVAVLFADQAPAREMPECLAAAGFYGVMLDTADKLRGGLCDCMQLSALQGFVQVSRSRGLLVGLAGSLRLTDIPILHALGPDYLGFRGALCLQDQRVSPIDPERVASVAELLRESNMAPEKEAVLLQSRSGFRIVQEIS